jgi:hypothetical protein
VTPSSPSQEQKSLENPEPSTTNITGKPTSLKAVAKPCIKTEQSDILLDENQTKLQGMHAPWQSF